MQNLKFKIQEQLDPSLSVIFKRGITVLKRSRLPRAWSCHSRSLRWLDKARQSRANKKFTLGIFYDFKTVVPSAGFTLIETIVALAVLTSAIVGPFTLATKGILNASFAKNKIIAAHLAQEGVELVRYVRENNILASLEWDAGLMVGSWQGDIFSQNFTPFSGLPILFDSSTGFYSQTSGSPTAFIRKIIILKPSANEMTVTSEVSWAERSIDRKVILSEKLYNWK